MKLLILPGDGIGPEITRATAEVLQSLNSRFVLGFEMVERDIGQKAYEMCGQTMPEEIFDEIWDADATILGPVDSYAYPPESEGGVNPSKAVRLKFDLFANLRPSKVRPGVPAMIKNMDLVVVRENTEGFYSDRNMHMGNAEFMPTPEVALSIRKITREGSRRIAQVAFEKARERRKKVTVVHKANVLKVTDGLFLKEVKVVGEHFPDVELEEVIVDAMAALLIRRPESFDVILTTNMYGDILSDEAAELSGGLGFGPSINVGENIAISQAAHGSAPDIAGHDSANPTAHMLSAQMLLQWIAMRREDNQLGNAAMVMEQAINSALRNPDTQTQDVNGPLGTRAFGTVVAEIIKNSNL
ncbi:MAG: 3-isopropylmalate dehydrogenase [Rhodospirillaceae bacterium TMED8]|nr:3-isopropylmalate dehydrogenase [Magnetovibrio sp.]OUT52280.1 MAG: 3-isopropylmalate dehydrogenase [Rhodospirillaceae bacterium TMED8]|tara:strand:- start:481 stop:1551 length:1071 start_codon:yes stop_codon:yes gene_type:complete